MFYFHHLFRGWLPKDERYRHHVTTRLPEKRCRSRVEENQQSGTTPKYRVKKLWRLWQGNCVVESLNGKPDFLCHLKKYMGIPQCVWLLQKTKITRFRGFPANTRIMGHTTISYAEKNRRSTSMSTRTWRQQMHIWKHRSVTSGFCGQNISV